MNVGAYICNQCNKNFKRKWNALHHNKKIHHDLAIISNKTNGFIYQNSRGLNSMADFDPLFEREIEKQNILDIFGKLMPTFTELEKELDGIAESDKVKNLYTLIIGALNSSDPVKKLQDALHHNQSIKGKIKIVSYVARGMNIPSIQAELYLDEIIRSSRYFKNYSKLNNTRF
jgi:hypothetical protein